MNYYCCPKTDLAFENYNFVSEKYLYENGKDYSQNDGISVSHRNTKNISITEIHIISDSASEDLKKKKGKYISLEFDDIMHFSKKELSDASLELGRNISVFTDDLKGNDSRVLVVGLGNKNVKADSLGPETAGKVLVSRHFMNYMPDEFKDVTKSVAVLTPGVLGTTGIETYEILKGIIDKTDLDYMIVIDSLAAGSVSRITSCIQITDTGIVPGSGVGNSRKEISFETTGIPVIVIGVPTVVDSLTLAKDVIEELEEKLSHDFMAEIEHYGSVNGNREFREVFGDDYSELTVTPKNIDECIKRLSDIIAGGINHAVFSGKEINVLEELV